MSNTKKIHNFSAGPSILSQYAIEKSREDLVNFANTGLNILEISHRSKQFEAVMDESRSLIREILSVPEDYDILFLQGGASTQFFQIPMNFLKTSASYTNTGTWATKAIEEAVHFGNVNIVASSEGKNFNFVPTEYTINNTDDYFHCTSNNTIYGTQIQEFPKCDIPLICDMSSDIFSRPVDVSKFDLIYAGAQKNLGPAGVTLVIIKKSMYNNMSERHVPTMLKYQTHAKNGSMYNTPPVFPILVSKYNLEWVKEMGGVQGMEKRNSEKADLLYSTIDNSEYFQGTAEVNSRSKMNVCFVFKPEFNSLEEKFETACKEHGISGIKGHRSVGGYRASLYNALPLDSVQALVDVMTNFNK
ncbi:MAG: 3-phosphoserine/phosphohydroxythreonine transaminase [Bacteroidia bacterium]|nr:3-phosphoserine/phosphohydroxythreonine transaminase [Bacteroidia bacterium]